MATIVDISSISYRDVYGENYGILCVSIEPITKKKLPANVKSHVKIFLQSIADQFDEKVPEDVFERICDSLCKKRKAEYRINCGVYREHYTLKVENNLIVHGWEKGNSRNKSVKITLK